MIVKLAFTNRLSMPVELLNNMGTGQTVLPAQTLEMTFDLHPDNDGAADLVLICEPG